MAVSMKNVIINSRTLFSGSASASTFTISPAVDGKTTWNLATDGPLNLGSYGEWTITPQGQVTVDAKMWGAAGAGGGGSYPGGIDNVIGGGNANIERFGGAGGYSTARIALAAGTSYVIQVGQGGIRTVSATSVATYLAGGTLGRGGTQGGGYTGIFASAASQANALLIAGGGGGGAVGGFPDAGAGGGASGQNGGADVQGGGGGTQLAGGAASIYNGATAGAALTGGVGADEPQLWGQGGGGGYFGGGGANAGGGGGGSGFFSTDGSVTNGSTTAGSGATPGNDGDAARAGAGSPAATAGAGGLAPGADGRIVLTHGAP